MAYRVLDWLSSSMVDGELPQEQPRATRKLANDDDDEVCVQLPTTKLGNLLGG